MSESSSDELIRDFTRVTQCDDGWRFEVAIVNWHGACDPFLVWHAFRRWKRNPSGERVAAAQAAALASKRFFRRCELCGEVLNRGHMDSATICHSCGERYLGYVH